MFEPLPAVYDKEEELQDLFDKLEECRTKTPIRRPPFPSGAAQETAVPDADSEEKRNARSEKLERRENTGVATKGLWTVHGVKGPLEITSWKFKEFEYARPDVDLPIRARGLFTQGGKIVARGYDKFFNVNEVSPTKLDILMKMKGPFSASTKENGCIILISGLEDGTLLVCSKHSTGESSYNRRKDQKFVAQHSVQGSKAVYEQLERIGRKPEELANILYKMNVTAVLELCDDSFEEHIVKYPKELAGLYLHGLNFNVKKFQTYPIEKVAQFADDWGFRKIEYDFFEKFDDLWAFLENLKTRGLYKGRELEGFVVRCKDKGDDFFFKYKFEEPYYLFRQLREVTMKLIEKDRTIREIMRSVDKHKNITHDYLLFAENMFEKDEELKQNYKRNKGIISMREKYMSLKGLSETDGMGLLGLDNDETLSQQLDALMKATSVHYIILPIATIACGKTTTFKTLTNLFPNWKHEQNDDSSDAATFYQRVLENADDCQVLFADKNFHTPQTRRDFFSAIGEKREGIVRPSVDIIFIGVNFLPFGRAQNNLELQEVTTKRLLERGDNHQCMNAKTDEKSSLIVLNSFSRIASAPTLGSIPENWNEDLPPTVIKGKHFRDPDDIFDIVINVTPNSENSSLEAAKTILKTITERDSKIEIEEISEIDWNAAFEKAKAYKPEFRKKLKVMSGEKKRAEYYGLKVEDPLMLKNQIDAILKDDHTWSEMKTNGRVQEHFHVTLGHVASIQPLEKQNQVHFEEEMQNKNPRIGQSEECHEQNSISEAEKKPQERPPIQGSPEVSNSVIELHRAQRNLEQRVPSDKQAVPVPKERQNVGDLKEDLLGQQYLHLVPHKVEEFGQVEPLEVSETRATNANETLLLKEGSTKKVRRQVKSKRPKKSKKEKTPISNKERWEILGRRFEIMKWRENATPRGDVNTDQFCDINIKKVIVVENYLVALKVEVSGPYKRINGEWVMQKPSLSPMNEHLHITMGTCKKEIRPMRSNYFLTKLYEQYKELPQGDYEIDKNTVHLFDVDQKLEKQCVFIRFQNFQEEKTKSD